MTTLSNRAPRQQDRRQERLAEYTDYADAQAAVDALSDADFPVERVTITWNRLRHVEYVTGRKTVASAALRGAMSGAWLGALLGLLLAAFVDLDDGVSGLELVVTYLVAGALLGAGFSAFQHWAQRGRRDFSAVGSLQAESYEVWVHADDLARASAIIGVNHRRPTDPDHDLGADADVER